MKKTNKLISILLVVAMLLSMAPILAFAVENIAYVDVDGSIKTATSATSVTASTTSWSSGWYYVGSNVTISSRISVSGDVNLILGGGYTLTASQGIHVGNGDKLTVYSQETAGTLIAYGTEYDAAIGGNGQHGLTGGAVDSSVGTIIINGGNITAQGGNYGAGIGGGWNSSDGNITVNGGNITAQGGDYAAGIGFSQKSTGTANIDITGGTVNANGGLGASGIGAGYGSENTALSINISGGKITAKGDHVATSDIGNGVWTETPTSVSITGGIIDASRIGNYDGGTAAVIKDLVGAEFVNDPSSFVPEGYIASYNEATGYYTVGPKGAIINGITSVDSISVIINGTEHGITAEDYTISSNNLILFVPSGKLLVTVNGEEYYGDFDGEFALLKKYYEVINLDVTPVEINVKTTYELSAEITPDNALNQSVSYEITDAGTTGATISGNKLTALYGGTIKIKATATDGYRNYSENFTVEAKQVNVTGISNDSMIPASVYPSSVVLPDTVVPSDASYNTIEWSVVSGVATISDNTVYFNESGTVTLRATVKNGLGSAKDFVKDYSVNVLIPEISKVSVADGNITISKIDESKLKVTYANGKEGVFDKTQLITVTGSSTSNSIVVESGSPIIVLDGCEVIRSQYYNPVTIKSGACAEIVLSGTNTLEGKTAICVAEGAELTISGNGVLNANGLYSGAAAIGGESNASSGKITVNSGYLKIKGDGAGIGVGGYSDTVNCGEITINGGDITIESKGTGIGGAPGKITVNDGVINITVKSQNSAIGSGGAENTKGSVTINGGTITASGSQYSAVIGARRGAGAVDVTITGGEITVTGGERSSGIGNGYDSDECKVTITGGNITATGGMSECGLKGVVTIDNATVNAIGGRQGSGIEGTVVINSGNTTATGGLYSDGIKGTVTVNGGTVTANGGSYGYGTNGTLTINGGEVTANGSTGGAGIGCKSTDTVTINGGTVYARGSDGGAGIGGGKSTDCGTVIINGGTVTANGGTEYSSNGGGAGIGGGYLGDGGTVVITGGNISATRGYNAQNIGAGAHMSEDGTLKDADGNNLNLNTISLDGATADTVVMKVEGISYGLNDVKTINTNKLYFYLPADTAATSITAGGIEYICNDNLTYRTAHIWKDATCSVPATCEACGATEGSINPSAHSWANNDGVCANGCGLTCDHAGQTGETCSICGATVHTHSFTYSASGDTITAVCANTDGNCPDSEGTLTILAPADLYVDGITAKEATIENNLVDTSVAISDIAYSAPYGLPPKDAGTYTASVTVGGATASVEFELVKRSAAADNFIYTAPENLVYDGTAKYATVEVSPEITGMGAITVTYYKDGEAVEPVDAGTYTVKVSTAESDKYYAINDVELASFTITAKDISDGSIILGDALTYNGKEQTQTVEKVLATGTAPEVTFTVSGNKATNVGVYLLTATGTGNFTGEAKIAYEIAVDDDCISHLDRVEDNGVMKWNVKSTDRESLEYIVDQLNNAVTDIADADKKSEWADIKEACEDMLRIINSIELFIADVEEDYAEFDIETVKSSDVPALDKLVSKVNEIKDRYGFNLTDEEEKKLEDILDGIEKLKAKIDETADEIARIDEAVNGYDEATVKYGDYKDILQLIDDIEALTTGKNITDFERSDLEELNAKANLLAAKIRSTADEISRITRAVNAYSIDTVKSSDKADIENLIARIKKLTDGDNITADERAKLNELDSTLDALLAKIDETADEIARLEAEVGKYDEATVKSSDKADIEQLKADIKALTDGQNITADERAKLENLDATADALLAKIAETKSEYDRVIAAANGYDEATVTSADKGALVQLNDDIYALALTDNVTEEEKENLQAAHNKVLGLIDKLTAISDEIKRIIEAVDKYVFESVKSSDKADIEQLIADIKELLDTHNITADERALLEGADETCTKLIAKIDETVAEINRINEATNSYDIDTVTSADKADIEKLLADIKALTDGDNVTDAEREQLNGNEATLKALLDKIGATADEIERIEKAVNGYDEETVKSTDKADLEQLKADIKALTDATNITENERTKLGELDAKIDALIKKIDDTAEEIERIDETVNGYDKETVTSDDVPELGKLIEDIKALTDGDNLTEDEKAALEETEKAIDDLVEKLTKVAEEIKRVDETVKSYDEETVKSSDKADLEQLKEDIQALIDSTNTTENEKTALDEMIEKVNALLDKISETEEKLEEIKGIENNFNPENVSSDDKVAIEEKIAEIESVNPDNLTEEQKAEYDEIKAGFEALLEEIEKAGSEVDAIGAELEMFDEERVTIFWEDEIEALKAKIDELLADENMGEAEKAKLNEYKAQCDNLIEIINNPCDYFSMRLFHFVWDALHWLVNHVVFIFNWIIAMFC